MMASMAEMPTFLTAASPNRIDPEFAAWFDGIPVVGLDHGELPHALVRVRRQDLDGHLPRLLDILHHLVRILDLARERAHVFHGVVGLQVRGLVRYQGVGRGMRLVKAVLPEFLDQVVDVLGDALRYLARLCSLEELFLHRVDDLHLLLSHRLPELVGLREAEAAHDLGDEHHLLLVDDDAQRIF